MDAGIIAEVDVIPTPGVLKLPLGQGEVIHLNLAPVWHGIQVHQQVHEIGMPFDIQAPVWLMQVGLSKVWCKWVLMSRVWCKWVLSTKQQQRLLDLGVGIKHLIIATTL